MIGKILRRKDRKKNEIAKFVIFMQE